MVTVSIVIPTFNRPEYLKQCLNSLREEIGEERAVEIIVIDDGSEHLSAERNRVTCKECQVRYYHSDRNRGMAVSRNYGIARSSGEWIVFLDDDVTVDAGWYNVLISIIKKVPDGAVGFEGRIKASGTGVWDHEVCNYSGGAYLTSHLGIRKKILEKCGPFDENFEQKGPFCEDHELAARVLQWGDVPFISQLSVTHCPRKVNLLHYVMSASKRCRQLLFAEHYFFYKHPDRYHCFRSHRTFVGTYRSVLFRNVLNDVRRRSVTTLLRHPLQTVALLLGSVLEQCFAWVLLPFFCFGKVDGRSPFGKAIASNRTADFWMIPSEKIDLLRVRRRYCASLFFRFIRSPVYDIRPTLARVATQAGQAECRVYLRIDDFFLNDSDNVRKICALFRRYQTPFLAAVTGEDLRNPQYKSIVKEVRESGGTIGIHGFAHSGTFGPFPSELLQIKRPEIMANITEIKNTGSIDPTQPLILIPPFNALGPQQIVDLSRMFSIICGGPETVRFTDRYIGPIAIDGGGWYFPSLYPFYGSAGSIIRSGVISNISAYSGALCMTTHLTCEAADSFNSLNTLLRVLPISTQPWNRLY